MGALASDRGSTQELVVCLDVLGQFCPALVESHARLRVDGSGVQFKGPECGCECHSGSAVFRVGVETEAFAVVPGLPQVAVCGDAAGVLEHPGRVHQVPRHEGRVAVGEVVLGAARFGIEVARTRADLADPTGVGGWRDAVADVLQAVEDRHCGMLDAVLVAGDQCARRLSVEDVLALVVEQPAHRVEAFDELAGDRGVVSEPDRAADDENVRGLNERPHVVGPGVVVPSVFPHVGVHAGGDLVVDETDVVHRHSLGPHQRDALVHQPLGVAFVGASFEGAVDEDRFQVSIGGAFVSIHGASSLRSTRVRPHLGVLARYAHSRDGVSKPGHTTGVPARHGGQERSSCSCPPCGRQAAARSISLRTVRATSTAFGRSE